MEKREKKDVYNKHGRSNGMGGGGVVGGSISMCWDIMVFYRNYLVCYEDR